MKIQKSYFLSDESYPIERKTVGELLQEIAAQVPDRPALKVYAMTKDDAPSAYNYAQLLEQSNRYAAAFLAHFEPGERVAVWLPNCAEWVFLQFGAALAGIVLVTVNPASTAREAEYLLKQSEVAGIICCLQYRGVAVAETVAKICTENTRIRAWFELAQWRSLVTETPIGARELPHVTTDDAVMIQYTSGTTGNPKGAILTHKGLVNASRYGERRFALDEGSVWLNPMPMFHTGGCVFMTLGCLWNRGTQIMLPGFDPELMLYCIAKEKVNFTTMVPTMIVRVMERPEFAETDFSSLRLVTAGGSAIAPSIVQAVEERFHADFMMIFGQTEACGTLCSSKRNDSDYHRTQTIGTPIPNTEACIMALDKDEILPLEEVGEICIRSELLFSGYYGMPEATAKAINAEGWYRTGDLGLMQADGYLQITGRSKDMIIRGGENVYPKEIEDILANHPQIIEAAVFGIPDNEWGEQVVAAVRTKDGQKIDENQLKDFLLEKVARFKIPKLWWFVTEYPTTTSGKIQKHLLKEQYLKGAGGIKK